MINPTGAQYDLTFGDYAATITEVGATLRSLTFEGRDLVRGFAADERVTWCRGQQLLPWPNRIRDGIYVFNGSTEQLDLSEPDRHNAIHGLARWLPWRLIEHADSSLTQEVTIYPQLGWSGILTARITHSLSAEGLLVEVTATNVGDGAVPFGYAAHPYLTVGEDAVDQVALTVPAASFLEVDDRLLPLAVRSVEGRPEDLRSGELLGETNLDTAFTDLIRDEDGRWRVQLAYGDRRAELWGDETCEWIQIFTGGDQRDLALAVEPMTCGPDAFNAGPTEAGLIVLEPGQSYRGQWGISGR